MPRHIAVVFVHGILAEDDSYADRMQERLADRLKGLRQYVYFEPIYWAAEIRNHQRNYMQTTGVIYNKLRKIVVHGLGDAAAYQKTISGSHSAYYRIQASITRHLDDLVALNHPEMLLIFIGHSLGCHIISSYVWDMNKLKQKTSDEIRLEPREIKELWAKMQEPKSSFEIEQEPAEIKELLKQQRENSTPFRRLGTLAGIVTLGSNIPLFTFAFGAGGFSALTSVPPERPNLKPGFPGSELDPILIEKVRWLNFFSEKDVLAYPLTTLGAYSQDNRIRDIRVRSERPISRYVPYWSVVSAHTRYWTNGTVLDETAKFIRDLIQ